MCLNIDSGKHKWGIFDWVERKASKDILVWKVISKNDTSVWRRFQYSKNKLYKIKLIQKDESIHQGYHAYLSRAKARSEREVGEKIVRFTIPKGAKYFIGWNDDIASNTIKSGDLKHCR